MAVEIRELVIRAVANPEIQQAASQTPSAGLSDDEKTTLIEACTRQVLRALRRDRER